MTIDMRAFWDQNPAKLLREVNESDELAAVRLASAWGDDALTHPRRYKAAAAFVAMQNIVPRCLYCDWPVLEDSPHIECEVMSFDDGDGLPWYEDLCECGEVLEECAENCLVFDPLDADDDDDGFDLRLYPVDYSMS